MFAPIGVALIGSGIFAREEHLPAILDTPSLSLKAVYSRTLESAAKLSEPLHEKIDWYSSETEAEGRGYKDLLSNTNIKGVIIALPISAQPAFIREALQAGKHVLSEKPIAKDVNTAHELLSFYRSSIAVDRISWSVGENYRFVETHVFAASEVQRLGRILGFRGRFNRDIKPGGKYYETAWRKVPEYQGGFLLDAGVHFTAVLRLLLGPEDGKLEKLSAFTCQLQEHLPPVDTANATLKCKSGASGVFEMSVGSTFKGGGFSIACEDGTVTILGDSVVTADKYGHESAKHFKSEGWGGVNHEVKCWAEGMQTGKWNPRMKPEEALADLEIIEAMLQSGERDGAPIDLKFQ
ncbi:MAG: hypothetical protein Q9159_006165 [Coniocarpon cinnabarinum]